MADGVAEGAVLWTGPIGEPDRFHVTAEALAAALAGGEGLVYLATDTHRHAPVALKVLTVVELSAYGRVAARAAAFESIDHPNLMSLIDVFIGRALTDRSAVDPDDFDVIYSVAEWIEGAPLADVVADTDTATVLGYVRDVARALDALHRHRDPAAPAGIVHRDVKPSNVRVTPEGAAVLIDFGAARPVDESGDMTQGVGTYRWRAPEVLSGSAPLSTAIDVWGLGALAYWALTGQPPGLEGAAAAREQLVHAPRCQELRDPVGVATHIAAPARQRSRQATVQPRPLGRRARRDPRGAAPPAVETTGHDDRGDLARHPRRRGRRPGQPRRAVQVLGHCHRRLAAGRRRDGIDNAHDRAPNGPHARRRRRLGGRLRRGARADDRHGRRTRPGRMAVRHLRA